MKGQHRRIFVIPAILYLLLAVVWPSLHSVYRSLTDARIGVQDSRFIGLRHYSAVLTTKTSRSAVRRSFSFALLATLSKCVLGILLALALGTRGTTPKLLVPFLVLPLALPGSLVAIIWMWLFYDVGGVVNSIGIYLSILPKPISWLGNETTAFIVVLLAIVWRGFPIFFLGFLLAIRSVPRKLEEMVLVDGGTKVTFWCYVGVHWIAPILAGLLILSFVLDLGEFEQIYIITRGGPGDSTHTAITLAYELAFKSNQIGFALAHLIILLPVVALCVAAIGKTELWLDEGTTE